MTDAIITGAEITSNKEVLSSLGQNEIQQRHIISAFEWFCGVRYPTLLAKFPIILDALFDAGLVDEEIFLMWASDYARNEYSVSESLISVDTLELLKGYAEPFITWLREAESEGDSSEEDES